MKMVSYEMGFQTKNTFRHVKDNVYPIPWERGYLLEQPLVNIVLLCFLHIVTMN